jgi:hypothetical protein
MIFVHLTIKNDWEGDSITHGVTHLTVPVRQVLFAFSENRGTVNISV